MLNVDKRGKCFYTPDMRYLSDEPDRDDRMEPVATPELLLSYTDGLLVMEKLENAHYRDINLVMERVLGTDLDEATRDSVIDKVVELIFRMHMYRASPALKALFTSPTLKMRHIQRIVDNGAYVMRAIGTNAELFRPLMKNTELTIDERKTIMRQLGLENVVRAIMRGDANYGWGRGDVAIEDGIGRARSSFQYCLDGQCGA
jgi:hypothetical protein